MKYSNSFPARVPSLLLTLALGIVAHSASAQHYHLNVSAPSQAQNTPLEFEDAADLGTNSGFALPLTLATSGTYTGHYESGALTISATGTGFPDAPAPGTQVRVRFLSVTGPADGSVGVWDVPGFNPDEDDSTNLAFSLPVGMENGTNSILVSENNGGSGADPFGHIHGRHFSATKPGLYMVTVQAYDAAANGAGGGPRHAPSVPLPIYFQAGDTIATMDRTPGQVSLTFGTKLGRTYYVQAAGDASFAGTWSPIAGPLAGDDHLQTVVDSNANGDRRFYRLRVPVP